MRTRFLVKGIKEGKIYERKSVDEYRKGITEALFQKYSNKGYSEVSVYVRKRERFSETIEGRYLKEFTENPKEDAIKRAAEVNGKIDERQKHTYKGPLIEYIVDYYVPCRM